MDFAGKGTQQPALGRFGEANDIADAVSFLIDRRWIGQWPGFRSEWRLLVEAVGL
jgi:hypothetical protein